jgi:hypothetical protein
MTRGILKEETQKNVQRDSEKLTISSLSYRDKESFRLNVTSNDQRRFSEVKTEPALLSESIISENNLSTNTYRAIRSIPFKSKPLNLKGSFEEPLVPRDHIYEEIIIDSGTLKRPHSEPILSDIDTSDIEDASSTMDPVGRLEKLLEILSESNDPSDEVRRFGSYVRAPMEHSNQSQLSYAKPLRNYVQYGFLLVKLSY